MSSKQGTRTRDAMAETIRQLTEEIRVRTLDQGNLQFLNAELRRELEAAKATIKELTERYKDNG